MATTTNGDLQSEALATASIDALLKQAAGVTEPSGMAPTAGWMAIAELDDRLGLQLDEYVPEDNGPNDTEDAIKRDAYLAQLFVTLQRIADNRGLDIHYGLIEGDVSEITDLSTPSQAGSAAARVSSDD